jgi:hypothetical protein
VLGDEPEGPARLNAAGEQGHREEEELMKVVTTNFGALAVAVVASGCGGAAYGSSVFPESSVQTVFKAHTLDDTGLDTCVDTATWLPTTCAGTGEDGQFGRDMKYPNGADGLAGYSFIKVCNNGKQAGQVGCKSTAVQGSGPHDWGCTKDLVTGLTWELRTSDGGIRDAHQFFSNFGTNVPTDTGGLVAAMNAQALCGATDWRLPSVTELFTIANFNRSGNLSAWIPDLGYGYDEFWTPEDYVVLPGVAWYVDTAWPETSTNWRDGSTQVTAARVVRGTTTLTHLVAKGNEVQDSVNHLSWRRCVEGMTWQKPNCVGTPTLMYWSDALAYANAVAASTGVPWRLPNIKELQSISALSHTPTIDPVLFPQTPALYTWSSTGWGEWWSIYYVDFGRGFASRESGVNESNFAVRLVRDID